MDTEYRNPVRKVKSRDWLNPADRRWEEIRNALFEECQNNELLHYCRTHHSIESKYTIKKHHEMQCETFTKGKFFSIPFK